MLNVLLYILFLLTRHWANKVRIDTVQDLILKYRTDTIQYLSGYSVAEYSKKPEATYLNWLNNDASLIEQNGFDSLFSIIESVFLVVLSAISLFQFHSALMLLTLFLSLLILTLPNFPCLKKPCKICRRNFLTVQQSFQLQSLIGLPDFQICFNKTKWTSFGRIFPVHHKRSDTSLSDTSICKIDWSP